MGGTADAGTSIRADVRADLAARIASLNGRASFARVRDMAPQVDAIRSIAARAGMEPAAAVAGMLNEALARGERGVLVHGWLHLLRDAAACERSDAPAREAFAAACQVRISG